MQGGILGCFGELKHYNARGERRRVCRSGLPRMNHYTVAVCSSLFSTFPQFFSPTLAPIKHDSRPPPSLLIPTFFFIFLSFVFKCPSNGYKKKLNVHFTIYESIKLLVSIIVIQCIQVVMYHPFKPSKYMLWANDVMHIKVRYVCMWWPPNLCVCSL